MDAFSYYDILLSSPIKGLLAMTGAGCAFLIFIYSHLYGTFGNVSFFDKSIYRIAIMSVCIYLFAGDPFLTQILIQICILLGFFPIIGGIYKGTTKEHQGPWIVVFSAYVFSTLSLLLDWQGNWIELLFPIINGVIMHAFVLICILYHDKLYRKRK